MSDFITLGGVPVTELRMGVPRVGVWVAEVATALGDDAPVGRQTLDINGVQWIGTVKRSLVVYGTPVALFIGGAAGLDSLVPPRHYRSTPLALILGDILKAAKESVAPSSSPEVLGYTFAHWVTRGGLAGLALSHLVDDAGPDVIWRVLQDGSVWIGKETWNPATLDDAEEVGVDPITDSVTVFTAAPTLLPGSVYSGRRVSYVSHGLADGVFRTRIYYEGGA